MIRKSINKKLLYGILYIPVVLIFCYCYSIFNNSSLDGLKKFDFNAKFNGRVDSLYFDKRNRNIKMAILSSGYRFGIYGAWEKEIEVGDSLSKTEKTFFLLLYKQNGKLVTLNYIDMY